VKHSHAPGRRDLIISFNICQSATSSDEVAAKVSPLKILSRANNSMPRENEPLTIVRRLRTKTARASAQQNKAAAKDNAELRFTIVSLVV
jgi:hypothetical protein